MATKAERLIPDLTPYPPNEYLVVHHPDVQLTAEEWMELKDYEKMESDALASPGVLGFMLKPLHVPVKVPVKVGAAKVHEGRGHTPLESVRVPPWRPRSGGIAP